jgi:tRNA (guanine10-N2)-methyltransferase
VGQKVRADDENTRSNFREYGLEANYIDVVVSDSSRPPWRKINGGR